MTEFTFWVTYYFNTKKWHTSTLNQNVKLDWKILSVVCRHHDWQLWCKGIIYFPFFSSGAQNIFRILGGCWNVSHCFVPLFLSVSPQALIFAMFLFSFVFFPSCSLRTIPVGQHVCCGLTVLLRLLFFLPEVVNRAFVHLLEVLNSVGFLHVTKGFVSCWNLMKCKCVEKRISPEMEGGWWLFKVYVFFPLLAWNYSFRFRL